MSSNTPPPGSPHHPATLWAIERGRGLINKAVKATMALGSVEGESGVASLSDMLFAPLRSTLADLIYNPGLVRPAARVEPAFREAIATIIRFTGVPCSYSNVITAERGAEQLLHSVFYALLRDKRKGALVLYPELHHAGAATLVQIAGGSMVPIKSDRGSLTPALLKRAIAEHPDAKMLFMMDPVDPTGAKLDAAQIAALAEVIREAKLLVVIDESARIFGRCFNVAKAKASLAAALPEQVVAIYSASQAFGLMQRLGFGIAPSWLAELLLEDDTLRNVNAIMQKGMINVADAIEQQKAQAYVEERQEQFRKETKTATEILGDHNLDFLVPPDAGGQAFMQLPPEMQNQMSDKDVPLKDAMAVCEALKDEQGIPLLPAEAFLSSEFGARVTTRKRNQIIKIAQMLIEFQKKMRAASRAEQVEHGLNNPTNPPKGGRGR